MEKDHALLLVSITAKKAAEEALAKAEALVVSWKTKVTDAQKHYEGHLVIRKKAKVYQKPDGTSAEGNSEPRDLSSSWVILPFSWDSEIEDSVNGINDIWSHDDTSINSVNHVSHGSSDNGQNVLESLDFLRQENVERDEFISTSLSKTFRSF